MTKSELIESPNISALSFENVNLNNGQNKLLPTSYIDAGVACLPQSERVVRFYSVDSQALQPEHYNTITYLYQKTYGPEFQPVPDVSKWIIALDEQRNICLGSLAITRLHDSAAPFILHGVPKGQSSKVLEDLDSVTRKEHDLDLSTMARCCEAGTFTVNSDGLHNSYDILNVARLVLLIGALHAYDDNYVNSVFVATKRVRLLLTRIGVWFWPFRPAYDIFGDYALSLSDICSRMHSELKFSQESINLVLEKYAEVLKEETRKIHSVRSGVVHIPQMIEQLSNSTAGKAYTRPRSVQGGLIKTIVDGGNEIVSRHIL
ncbi:MAG: hypothetical protein IT291_09320 [Deltaproteobacteria bacterium]|nr:hypothetical protein [Deltaproteobacteria bacterium]